MVLSYYTLTFEQYATLTFEQYAALPFDASSSVETAVTQRIAAFNRTKEIKSFAPTIRVASHTKTKATTLKGA